LIWKQGRVRFFEDTPVAVAIDQGFQTQRYIINHDIMDCTADGVVGNYLYSGRALGVSAPQDLIQLHPQLRPLWKDISKHYARIKLPHSRNVIWEVGLQEIRDIEGFTPSFFFFGARERSVWEDHDWFRAVDYINSKNNFISLAGELGVDVPRTHCFEHAVDITADDISDMAFPCYLKASISVSGVGIYRCENSEQFSEALKSFEPLVPVQVQEEIETDVFLNLQYQITDGQLERLAASEQILDGFAHQGNRYPACCEPWESVEPMAKWLQDQGIQGVFAFDVAVMHMGQEPRFPVIECNPRFNGASYPTMIANKLAIPEWSARTYKTRHRDLSQINLDGIEFNPMTRIGVIVVNWGTVLEGKLVFLLAGSCEQQEALSVELKQRL